MTFLGRFFVRATFVASVLLLGLILGPAKEIQAATKTWLGASSNWSPGSWSGGSTPASGDLVNIAFNDATNRTVTLNVSSTGLGLISLDNDGTGTSALEINSPVNLGASAISIGGYSGLAFTNGQGALTQSNGNVTISSGVDLIMAWGAGSTGTYMLSGGTLTAPQSEFVGYAGNATFNHSGGTNTIQSGAIGAFIVGQNGATGRYNLSVTGALDSNKSEYVGVGAGGVGFFSQSGGTNHIIGAANNLYIGDSNGSGDYTLTGGILTVDGNINVGNAGAGSLNIQGSSNVYVASALNINSANDTVNLNGGKLRVGSISNPSRFFFTTGTLQLAGNRSLSFDPAITTSLGAAPNLSNGRKLIVEGNATIGSSSGTTVTVSGVDSAFNSLGTLKLATSSHESATLNISNGAAASHAGVTVGAYQSGSGEISTGTANISGVGTTWNTGAFIVGDEGEGHVTVTGGASVVSSEVNMGYADGPVDGMNTGLVSGAGSSWSSANDFWVGALAPATLEIANGARVYVEHKLYVWAKSSITLNGGTIRFDTYQNFDNGNPEVSGKIIFNSGTIQLAGSRTLGFDPILLENYGKLVVLPAGKGLAVEEIATIPSDSGLTINGGTMRAKNLAVNGPFQFSGGVLEITGGAITGLASLNIPSGGEFRATGTQDLRISGAAGSTITATGNLTLGSATAVNGFYTDGTLTAGANTVTLSDANDAAFDSGAVISLGSGAAPGTLNAANGLTLDFGGNAVGFGTITTPNTVAKPLINNGHITGASAAQKITLPGYVKGVGTFDNVSFTGTFSPGLSPTALQAGNIDLSNISTLVMELGGTSPGSGYDQIQSSGQITFDGTLQLALINGFTPAAGQSFNLFDWLSTAGSFDVLQLPTIAGLAWNTSQLYTDGIIRLAAAGLAGDYNQDGRVDAADYTVWRDRLNSGTSLPNDDSPGVGPDDYTRWKNNFGQPGSGSGSITSAPEPTSFALLGLGVALSFGFKRRS